MTRNKWHNLTAVAHRARLPQVYIIHRRDEFRASKIMAKRALDNPKIEVIWDSAVESAYGNEKGLLGGVKVRPLCLCCKTFSLCHSISLSEMTRNALFVKVQEPEGRRHHWPA